MKMFGRSYSQAGNTDSDYLIKTKGQVKIQLGNKFIDLIKDGKINVDSKFIFKEKQVGSKDGIYVIGDGEDQEVVLVIGGQEINLKGEIGNTYVSFMGEQVTDSESKYRALVNIGFIYKDLAALDTSSLQNGIVYVEADQKLYTIKDGQVAEFSFEFPNPFTTQFVISKNDDSIGSLLIKGSGINNSLAFESLYLFTEEGVSYLKSDGEINILIGDETYINVTQSRTTIKTILESNTIQSIGASNDSGFMLYIDDSGSTLIVDNLIVRNQTDSVSSSTYPVQWSLNNNIITQIDQVSDPSLGDGFALSLKYENTYKVGDFIYFYGEVDVTDFSIKLIRIPAEVKALNTETGNIVYVSILQELMQDVGSLSDLPNCIGQTTFLIGSDQKLEMIRTSQHNVDVIECQTIQEEQDISCIQSRLGDLTELGLFERDNVTQSNPPIEGSGFYSQNGVFIKAGYANNYALSDDDDSTKMASTEWVRKLLGRIIPKGTITAYHGDSIPDGWALCDGQNGTPNLLGKFIKAGEIEEEGGQDEILLKATDIPLLSSSITTSVIPGSFAGKLIPTFDSLQEFVVDKGGSSNHCLYTGKNEGDNGLTALPVESLSSILDVSPIVGTDPSSQTTVKINPKYYSLVFIMKME